MGYKVSGICAIISGGDHAPLYGIENADFVIACDRGIGYAEKEGITPDLLVGDFDSFSGDLPIGISVLKLPCEKDETDTMAAIDYAIEAGFSEIRLFCALGGRLDHLLGNLQAAVRAAKSGIEVKISDKANEIYVFSEKSRMFPKKEGFSISLIALTDRCENVSLSGGKYVLENAVITNAETLGISNEWIDDITVSVGKGVLAVVMSRL